MSGVRVTMAHDFLDGFAGSERVLATIASLYPDGPVWATMGYADVAERMGIADRFRTTIPHSEPLLGHFRAFAPLYPFIVRSRRLPPADVLLTSSYAFALGYRTENDAPQLCYCHCPIRFAWAMTAEYGERMPGGRLGARALERFAAAIRRVDRRRADQVTRFVAPSSFVAQQIERFYHRPSTLIRPPVDTDRFVPSEAPPEDYFLFCGRLVEPYKQPTIAVEAFRGLGHRLIVAGEGPELEPLRRSAPPNVEFRGQLEDDELIPLMQRCAALVFPSRDDFGLMPIEAMACGRPVLAFGAGGVLETMLPGTTGELFTDQSADGLAEAVTAFDPGAYDPAVIREHALGFGLAPFRDAIRAEVEATARGEWL
jgi:glycosyltransferase involved in cell wall biosynthesis